MLVEFCFALLAKIQFVDYWKKKAQWLKTTMKCSYKPICVKQKKSQGERILRKIIIKFDSQESKYRTYMIFLNLLKIYLVI